MHIFTAKYRGSVNLLVLISFLCLCNKAYTQSKVYPQAAYSQLGKHLSSLIDSISGMNSLPVPCKITLMEDKGMILLGSLKEKASKNTLTRKIYDIVVTVPDTSGNRNVSAESEAEYTAHSGKIIRNITIKRLDVFGADIANPDVAIPYSNRNILNKTHINTNERIIRNNLLFSAGDTLSPLALSDNERILRDHSFIDDAKISVVPVSKDEVDIIVITKDVYSLGGSFSPFGLTKGKLSIYENNFMGMGHELGIEMPFDNKKPGSPGLGINYLVNNFAGTFSDFRIFYHDGLGEKSYGIDVSRDLVSSTTKYAGGISLQNVSMNVDLDTLTIPEPLRYNLQDYWLSRSFLLNKITVTRLIFGARYTNNNVFDRPFILPDSYHPLQKYRLYLGSVALSKQRFYKTNLVYGYGRTEDIPYGGLIKVTLGKEINEFKIRNYASSEISYGGAFKNVGYVYGSAGLAAFINGPDTEQGILSLNLKYFSNLVPLGRSMIRNFLRVDYTRGFDRNMEERLNYFNDNGFSGYRNDSIQGAQRLTLNLETVVFSPLNVYGFKFAFFGFADFSSLSGTNQILANGTTLTGLGIGIRVRNDNLVFNTFQIRLGFFPDPPIYSRISHITVSGEHPLKSDDFDSGAPSMMPYR